MGARVHDLQVVLTVLGLLSGADGDYSATTSTAAASFRSMAWRPTASPGPATAAALNEAFSQRAGVRGHR